MAHGEADMAIGRVLLVDGQKRERETYAKELEREGLEVIEAKGHDAAEKLARAGRVDLVLLDVGLPRMTGLDVLKSIRQGDPSAEVVLMITKDDRALKRRALAQGALSCVTKPLVVDEILELIARVHDRLAQVRFRNRRGEETKLPAFNATDVKNAFGRMLDTTRRTGGLVVTKHDKPAAVLLAWDEFEALRAVRASSPLQALTAEFDELMASLQTPAARKGLKRAFDMTPEQIGKAAVDAAARRRG
jgi:antitoxin Phd